MQVYLAGPMTHLEDEGSGWRQEVKEILENEGFDVVLPHQQLEYELAYDLPTGVAASDKILTVRDRWAAMESDVVLANFEQASKASIGTSIELGWANAADVPIVANIPSGNIHDHPMVTSIVDFLVHDLDSAVKIVMALGGDRLD